MFRQRMLQARTATRPHIICDMRRLVMGHQPRKYPADLQRVCVVYAGPLGSAVRTAGCHRRFLQQRGV
jgi:hypothetical protein